MGLRRECPDGVNAYLDNGGREMLDTVSAHLARGARVVLSGAVSQYNVSGPWRGPSNYMSLLVNRAAMVEQIVDGLAELPNAVATLFAGVNLGKLVPRTAIDE